MRKTVSPPQEVDGTLSSPPLLSETPNSTSHPGLNTGTKYPGSQDTSQTPILVSETDYPGVITTEPGRLTQTAGLVETVEDNTGKVSETSAVIFNATISSSATGTIQSTTREGIVSATPTLQTIEGSPYPGLEIQSTNASYPGLESTPGFLATLGSAYPASDVTPSNNLPVATNTNTPLGRSTMTTTPTRNLSNMSSTATQFQSIDQAGSSTPVPTVFFVPTVTSTPTKTPFQTPIPTTTPTPTNTRTPLPFPPWISSRLSATDPRTVRLVSGRFQLVVFFAYWNGPSQAMAPLLIGLDNEYKGRVDFIYLDIDNPANSAFKRQLGFKMEPQFFLLDPQGKVLEQWIGYVTVEQLRKAFDTELR